MKIIEDLINITNKNQIIAVATAEDIDLIKAIIKAEKLGWAFFQLYGDKNKISNIFKYLNKKISNKISIFHYSDEFEAARAAVVAVYSKQATILMKGKIPTKSLLQLVLDKKYDLYLPNSLLSHIAVIKIPKYHKLLFITDCALNINPNFEQYIKIINNALIFAKTFNIDSPKIALLAAIEKVNERMPITLIWQKLLSLPKSTWNFINEIDGPLSLDSALILESAKNKNINSVVAGDADILVVPNIESGNILYKSLVYFANAKVAGVITGAKIPIILTSRSDSFKNKLFSIALAIQLISKKER